MYETIDILTGRRVNIKPGNIKRSGNRWWFDQIIQFVKLLLKLASLFLSKNVAWVCARAQRYVTVHNWKEEYISALSLSLSYGFDSTILVPLNRFNGNMDDGPATPAAIRSQGSL
jgi:hypothetical protein